jgi:hypothetical protein
VKEDPGLGLPSCVYPIVRLLVLFSRRSAERDWLKGKGGSEKGYGDMMVIRGRSDILHQQ